MNKSNNADRYADDLNYNGSDDSLMYVGQGDQDDSLSYAGETGSLISKVDNARRYSFACTNKEDSSKVVALSWGVFTTAAFLSNYLGKTVYALVNGTTVGSFTMEEDTKYSLLFFHNWTVQNVADLREIQIIASNKLAWGACSMELWDTTPLEEPKRLATLPLIDVFNEYQNQDNKVTIDVRKHLVGMQFDSTRTLLLTIGGTNIVATDGIRLQFTYKFGAVLSNGHAMASKRKRAEKNAVRMVAVRKALQR